MLGLGNLGLFLARHFLELEFQVSGWDINPSKRSVLESLGGCLDQDDKTADAVIFALFPKQITKQLVEGLNPKTLLVNVSSVQQPGIKALLDAGVDRERIFSFHPLFGPVGVSKSGWVGKQIIVTVHENDSRASALLETFTRRGVIIDQMSPEEHDKKMLPHALAFLIAELVKVGAEGADPRFLTGSGHHMLGLLDFTEAGSPELRSLVLSNPELKEVVPKLRQVLDRF